jgi:hypothetical protein
VTNRVAAGATARSDGGGSKPEVEEEDGTRIAGCFERPIGSECERINSEKNLYITTAGIQHNSPTTKFLGQEKN